MQTTRLSPTAPNAEDAILVGDPGRALALAQIVLDEPKMSNHARGLWGYTSADPESGLTVQSTGMGGPSAVAVLADLARLGVRRAVRVGTCRALHSALVPGEEVRVGRVIGLDGTSRALGADEVIDLGDAPGPDDLVGGVGGIGEASCASFDLDPAARSIEELRGTAAGTDVADMQTAALAQAAKRYGIEFGAILIVAWGDADDRLADTRLAGDDLEAAAKSAGEMAAAILSHPPAGTNRSVADGTAAGAKPQPT